MKSDVNIQIVQKYKINKENFVLFHGICLNSVKRDFNQAINKKKEKKI